MDWINVGDPIHHITKPLCNLSPLDLESGEDETTLEDFLFFIKSSKKRSLGKSMVSADLTMGLLCSSILDTAALLQLIKEPKTADL